MRPEKRRAAVIGTLLVLSVPTAVLAPFLLRTLIDDVLPRRDLRDVIIVSSQMVGLSLISGLLGYLQSVLAIGVHNRVRFRITRDLFAHVLRLPLGWIHKHSTGYLMSRMRDDIAAVAGMVNTFVPDAVQIGRVRIEQRVFEQILRKLPQGYALLSNDRLNRVLAIKVRPRLTVHGGSHY